jgi:Tfp pilus assembly protein PilN
MMSAPNQVSFLPEDYLDRKAQRRTNVICAILAAIVMGAIGSAFSLTERLVSQAERRHAVAEEGYAKAARQIQEVHDMEEKQQKMARQAELAASLLEKIPRSLILANVTNGLPQDVSMLEFNLDSRRLTAASASAAQNHTLPDGFEEAEPIKYAVTLRVTGIAANDMQVAEFIRNLSHSPLFTDVNLIVSDELDQDQGAHKVRRFEVEMTLNNDADLKGLENHLAGANTGTKATATVDQSSN